MNKTSIEWTDFTVNPFRFRNLETGKVGHHCTRISPGCKNCYSGQMQKGPYLSGLTFIEENKPKGEFFLDEGALQQVLRRKKPARIFWCDMTDMFLEDYPDEWIDRCFAVMALTPHLAHQVLTKRGERMREYFTRDSHSRWWAIETAANKLATDHGLRRRDAEGVRLVFFPSETMPRPLPNVWLGVSVEDRDRLWRADLLRETSAALRFLSIEPLLGDIGQIYGLSGIDWVIVGGESGPNARPCDLAWLRNLVEQCKAAGVAVFVKQLGSQPAVGGKPYDPYGTYPPRTYDRKGGKPSEWPEDLRVREMPNKFGSKSTLKGVSAVVEVSE